MKIALAVGIALLVIARAQNDTGFISIDCGTSIGYDDENLGLTYSGDSGFVESGEPGLVGTKYFNQLQNQPYLMTLRTFPNGTRNCYTLKPSQGKNRKYLIRASFMYGNYDNKFKTPSFDLHIDVNYWTTVVDISNYTYEEIIYTPLRDVVQVCVVNRESGNPIISALELRPLDNTTYQTTSRALLLNGRNNIGSTGAVRYPQDVYDRIWVGQVFNTTTVTNSTTVDGLKVNDDRYKVPIEVLRTAQLARNTSRPLTIFWESDATYKWLAYLHFAEIQMLQPGQLRQFSVYVNTDQLVTTVTAEYLKPVTVFSPTAFSGDVVNVSLKATANSTLPPFLNAIEYFRLIDLPNSPTELVDVNAMIEIKSTYEVVKDSWQGDPCVPIEFTWIGLGCSNDSTPRITSLNLSSSGLHGGIADALANLTALVTLDLSSNELTGQLPEFFAELPNLKLLNLSRNNLTGSIPESLQTKVAAGLLQLSLDGNPNILSTNPPPPPSSPSPSPPLSPSSGQNKKFIQSPLVAALTSAVVFLIVLAVL